MSVKIINFDGLSYYTGGNEEFLDTVFNRINKSNNKIIIHINLRNYYYLQKDKNLEEEIKKNCTIVLEGIGMKMGLLLQRYGLLQDINFTDLFPMFLKKILKYNLSVYLLGGKESVIRAAAENILLKNPGIKISGYHSGYFPTGLESEIVEKINSSKPDILLIGIGFPRQEKFALKYLNEIDAGLIWSVGGLFDFISGIKPRAPFFLRKLRLEWLFRLLLEPRRMIHRNTIAAFWSLFHIFFHKQDI